MTLMVMVIMSIAGLALLRAVDNSTLVAGNIGYKQAAIISTDSAIKSATDWMLLGTTNLSIDAGASGFYSASYGVITGANGANPIAYDWTGQLTPTVATDDVDWDGTNAAIPTKARPVTFPNGTTMDASGNRAYYVIHRLCDTPATLSTAANISCATSNSQVAAVGSTAAAASYGQKALTTVTQVFYRITIKVVGPKNTVSYTQAFVII
jgi:type IV pilus assembly protein PilX